MPEFSIWETEEEPTKENQGVTDEGERKSSSNTATWAVTRDEGG